MLALMITKPDCIYCEKAKDLLQEKGVGYLAYLYNEHPLYIPLMIKAGLKTVPQIWIDNQYIGGYTELVEYFNKGQDNA